MSLKQPLCFGRVHRELLLILCLSCAALWPWGTNAAPSVDAATLLEQMTNLQELAEFPDPPFTCKQFSSYDRASKSLNEAWFANGDAGQFIRVEQTSRGTEHVMMDADGPGAIVRIWSANPAGKLRIYLDGKSEPVLEAEMTELLGGKFPGLEAPLSGVAAQGWNLYFPIVYAKRCKVTSDKPGFYYHVNYRTYSPGVQATTFSTHVLSALREKIGAVQAALTKPGQTGNGAVPFEVTLQEGEDSQMDFEGPSAISYIELNVNASDLDKALRGTVVRATFDGEKCVEVPLGDFFGSAPGVNAFETLPLSMSKDGKLRSRWFMPFEKNAKLQVVNLTAGRVALAGAVKVLPYRWTERSMHFHAGWHAQFDVKSALQDWNYMTAEGRGVFAGVSFAIDNPTKAWWGEGDEKIYVDGEKFPSHFGTGTEDYYGYAWCSPQLFTHAYHSQSRCDGPANFGRTSVNRFDILDRIPFERSFRFDMELWHWDREAVVNMAATTYWYGRPGANANYQQITTQLAVVRPMDRYSPKTVAGAIEGEKMRVLAPSAGANPQEWADLSGDSHLWWHQNVKPGNVLRLGFNAPKQGTYKIYGRFMSAKDYGIHSLEINGRTAGQPIDFYNPDVKPMSERLLGTFELNQGENVLSVTAKGANPKADPSYMFGLDYLRLEP